MIKWDAGSEQDCVALKARWHSPTFTASDTDVRSIVQCAPNRQSVATHAASQATTFEAHARLQTPMPRRQTASRKRQRLHSAAVVWFDAGIGQEKRGAKCLHAPSNARPRSSTVSRLSSLLVSAVTRRRSRRGSCGPISATWRPRIWPSATRSTSTAPLWRSCASARSAAGRGQAARLQSEARAAWLAIDPYGGRDRQRRHAVPGRQRQPSSSNRHGLGIHLDHPSGAGGPARCCRRLLDLGLPGEIADGPPRELHACRGRPARANRRRLAALEADLRRVLADVRYAVADWRAMRDRIGEVHRRVARWRRLRCRPSSARRSRRS